MTRSRVVATAIALFLVINIIVLLFQPPGSSANKGENLSLLLSDVNAGVVRKIEVRGDILRVTKTDGTHYNSRKETDVSIVATLSAVGVDPSSVDIVVRDPSIDPLRLLLIDLPIIALIGAAVLLWRWRSSKH